MRTPQQHAQSARAILTDETFNLACEEIDAEIIRRWRLAEDPAERERLHSEQHALDAIKRQLKVYSERHPPDFE